MTNVFIFFFFFKNQKAQLEIDSSAVEITLRRVTNHKKMVSLTEKEPSLPSSQDYEMKRTNSLIIIDYDDTLLPSTWLMKRRFFEGPQETTDAVMRSRAFMTETMTSFLQEGAYFDALDVLTDELFRKANHISGGSAWIVSNGEPSWIEQSMGAILPKLRKTLYEEYCQDCRVISARQQFQAVLPDNKPVWKVKTFNQLINRWVPPRFQGVEQRDEKPTQARDAYSIISIGDSENDAESLMDVETKLTDTFRKTVKLVDNPTLGQVVKQVKAVKENLEHILESKGDLHLVADWGV